MPPHPAHDNSLDGNSLPSVFGYLCIYPTALFISYLTIVDPAGAEALMPEDGWVENLTAIGLFLAGVMLFATAWMERSSVRRCACVLGGLAMVFGAGEEIDWGQRMFGFATPDLVLHGHQLRKTNIHNIGPLDRIITDSYVLLSFFLCTVTLAAFFCNKKELFRIPLPSIPLILCFFMMLIYKGNPIYYASNPVINYLRLPLTSENALLTLLLFFILFRRKAALFIATLAVLAFSYAHAYADARIDNYPLFPRYREIREFLFGLCCLFYAVELFCRPWIMDGASRRPGILTKPDIHPYEEGSGGRVAFAGFLSVNLRSSMINGICALMIAGSIGLAALGYFNPGMTAAFVEKGYSRIKDAEPIIRSEFDVYLIENQLIYFKTPCAPSDKDTRSGEYFFLHVVPTDTNALTGIRRKHGFDNLDGHVSSSVRLDATHAGGRCLSIVPLPDYDVASISTGQFTGDVRSWEGTFRFSEPPV